MVGDFRGGSESDVVLLTHLFLHTVEIFTEPSERTLPGETYWRESVKVLPQ